MLLELSMDIISYPFRRLAGEDSYRLLDSLCAFAVEQLNAQLSDGDAAPPGWPAGWRSFL